MMKNSEVAKVSPGLSKILNKWNCTDKDKSILLGYDSLDAYLIMQSNTEAYEFSENQILRISYILNIYRSLNTLFSQSESSDNWVNKPNNAYLFKGKPAIEVMKGGELNDLAVVANYLHSISQL
tara:strand:- start:873 stop:1244 length:372 start_codon:yes stop_codon:yes gene_type:complete